MTDALGAEKGERTMARLATLWVHDPLGLFPPRDRLALEL